MKSIALVFVLTFILSGCGKNNEAEISKNPPALNVSKTLLEGEWRATVEKENLNEGTVGKTALVIFKDNQMTSIITCSLNGKAVFARIVTTVEIKDKTISVSKSVSKSQPLPLDGDKTYACTAKIVQGTFNYKVEEKSLFLAPPIFGQEKGPVFTK